MPNLKSIKLVSNFHKEKNFKQCLTKQHLNMLKEHLVTSPHFVCSLILTAIGTVSVAGTDVQVCLQVLITVSII